MLPLMLPKQCMRIQLWCCIVASSGGGCWGGRDALIRCHNSGSVPQLLLAVLVRPCLQDGFVVQTLGKKVFTDVDLSEGEWVEFDDKLNDSVGIYGVESKWELHKGK